MLKSIAIVSKELGISKAAIYKKLKDEKYKSLITKEKNKIMINEELFEMLKSKRNKKVETIKAVEILKPKEVEIISTNKSNNHIEEIIRLIENETINCEEEKIRFVKDQINKIKLKISNLNTFKIWVIGGGSLELQQGLRNVLGEINYIPNTIFSNVNGNKIIAELKWGKENG